VVAVASPVPPGSGDLRFGLQPSTDRDLPGAQKAHPGDDASEQAGFLAEYRDRIASAYPALDDGTVGGPRVLSTQVVPLR